MTVLTTPLGARSTDVGIRPFRFDVPKSEIRAAFRSVR
jgi:hypothetical protein